MKVDDISVWKEQIGKIFSHTDSTLYFIPPYQRTFAWGKNEWNRLYDDIFENEEGYFIGNVIYVPSRQQQSSMAGGNQSQEIIDGDNTNLVVFSDLLRI